MIKLTIIGSGPSDPSASARAVDPWRFLDYTNAVEA
jgi:hypothetical protein